VKDTQPSQLPHRRISGSAHSSQNFALKLFSCWHFGHSIAAPEWSERDDHVNVARNRRQGASAPLDFREHVEILATLTVPRHTASRERRCATVPRAASAGSANRQG